MRGPGVGLRWGNLEGVEGGEGGWFEMVVVFPVLEAERLGTDCLIRRSRSGR